MALVRRHNLRLNILTIVWLRHTLNAAQNMILMFLCKKLKKGKIITEQVFEFAPGCWSKVLFPGKKLLKALLPLLHVLSGSVWLYPIISGQTG